MNDLMKKSSSKQLIQALMDVSDGICFVKDNDFIYEYVNNAFCRLLNVSPNDIIGKTDFDIFPAEIAATFRRNDERILNSKEPESVEESGLMNGNMLYYRSNKAPLINEEGEVYGVCGIATNIGHEKELEAKQTELIERLKTANQIKDKIFSVISHDLRSPFNALINCSKILCEESEDISKELQLSLSHGIYSASANALLLLENLLAWSQNKIHKQPISKQSIDMSSIATQCINTYKLAVKDKSISLSHNIEKNSHVYADLNCLQIVLNNLVNNAIKFTPENGVITISLENNKTRSILSVKDNGVGISSENINRIFDNNQHFTTYGTSSEKGTGLGLGLCHDLIKENNGDIWVNSLEGSGSCFYVSLPNS